VDVLLTYLRAPHKEPILEISPTEDNNLVVALLRIYRALLKGLEV
jgi:hypothetical protein